MTRVCIAVMLAMVVGCNTVTDSEVGARAKTEPSPRVAILRNMPTNSNKRCLGITIVVEALLDGTCVDGEDPGELGEIAQRIYDNLAVGRPLTYCRQVAIDGVTVAITSETAIDRLSTLVADKYKRDYNRLMETNEGRQVLLNAQRTIVPSIDALGHILDADVDQTDAFCGSGIRLFPDETIDDTYHVFLIARQADGKLVVYDANDPGRPIDCRLVDTGEGLTVEWTCRYRDTGQTTTQRYLVVHKDAFFRRILGATPSHLRLPGN